MTELEKFVDWLENNDYIILKENPLHRPGEGYGPPAYVDIMMPTFALSKFKCET